MPSQDEVSDVDTRLSVLTMNVEMLTEGLREVTKELRRTNDTVQSQQSDSRLFQQRIDNISREVWDHNNASRIQSLELHVRGIYAVLAFLAAIVISKLAPEIFRFIVSGK